MIYLSGDRPQRGKSALMALLLANLNVGAADVTQGFVQPGGDLLNGVGAFGKAAEEQTIVSIGHAGDADKAQPVSGMIAMDEAAGGVREAGTANELVKDAKTFGVGSDLGVVAELDDLPGGKVHHAGDAAPEATICNPQPEGAGKPAQAA